MPLWLLKLLGKPGPCSDPQKTPAGSVTQSRVGSVTQSRVGSVTQPCAPAENMGRQVDVRTADGAIRASFEQPVSGTIIKGRNLTQADLDELNRRRAASLRNIQPDDGIQIVAHCQIEWHRARGTLYVHDDTTGCTLLRICGLTHIPFAQLGILLPGNGLDITIRDNVVGVAYPHPVQVYMEPPSAGRGDQL